jgi:hypothetical protein
MFSATRPDTTTEGWNSWPTQEVSHALVVDPGARGRLRACAIATLASEPADVAALRLAPAIHELVVSAVTRGEAEHLRDGLVAFALSRVDWLQLAQAEIEAAIPEDDVLLMAHEAGAEGAGPVAPRFTRHALVATT